MKAKFSIGDKVKIINYGHPTWHWKEKDPKLNLPIIYESERLVCYDVEPSLVGKEAIVKEVTGQPVVGFFYSLTGVSKTAWYNECQLELI